MSCTSGVEVAYCFTLQCMVPVGVSSPWSSEGDKQTLSKERSILFTRDRRRRGKGVVVFKAASLQVLCIQLIPIILNRNTAWLSQNAPQSHKNFKISEEAWAGHEAHFTLTSYPKTKLNLLSESFIRHYQRSGTDGCTYVHV